MRKRVRIANSNYKSQLFSRQPPTQEMFNNLIVANTQNNDIENNINIDENNVNIDIDNDTQQQPAAVKDQLIEESDVFVDDIDKNGLYWRESEDIDEISPDFDESDFVFPDSTAEALFHNENVEDYVQKFRENADHFANGNYEQFTDDGEDLFEQNQPHLDDKKRSKFYKKKDFCKKFYAVSIKHNLSGSAIWDILNVFDTCTEYLSLPLKRKEEGKATGFDDEVENKPILLQSSVDLEKYIEKDKSTLSIDICSKGCCAYLGCNAQMINCPHCAEPRFSQCSEKSCKKKKYHQCNHKIESRTPFRSMYYRSIIYVLTYKLMKSINKTDNNNEFSYLSYLERNLNNQNISRKGTVIVDTIYSDPVRVQYEFMCQHFQQILPIYKSEYPNCKIIMKNFILSGFFDADTFFKRKGDSVWAYLISIHNCCPSDRMKLGKGLFLSIYHKEKLSTSSSRFLMEKVFVKELLMLEYGVPIL
jgi:hypothetical protein